MDDYRDIEEVIADMGRGYPMPVLTRFQWRSFVDRLLAGGNDVLFDPSDQGDKSFLITEMYLDPDLTKYMGPGLIAVMGGEQRVRRYLAFCRDASQGGKRLLDEDTMKPMIGTQGYGMALLSCNWFNIAFFGHRQDELAVKNTEINTTRVNRRFIRSWGIVRRKVKEGDPKFASVYTLEQLEEILARFEQLGLELPSSKVISIYDPGENILANWRYLKGEVEV